MSAQWIPSNGTEGHQFINDWCSRCARDSVCNGQKTFDDCDDSELCQILAASFRGDAKEWIEHDDGRTESFSDHNGDRNAALRLCALKVAAMIGEGME